jgi:hydrogenase maturation protease
MERAPVVVFAVGNPDRGDDAIGPLLARRLGAWLGQAGLEQQVELIEDFQLQLEHAMDLESRRLALFVDAGERTWPPVSVKLLKPGQNIATSTHALSPEAVLQVGEQIGIRLPEASWVICVRGEDFALGTPPGQIALTNMEEALETLKLWLATFSLEG